MKIISGYRPKGYVMPVLHAHLPFIRRPENERHLEECWFYEAVTECYIPLLEVLGALLNDGTDFRLTLSLTPTLLEMFRDSLLKERFEKYLLARIELSEREIHRTRSDGRFRRLAKMYRRKFRRTLKLFEDTYGKDLSSAFNSLRATGKVELIASAATHAYLPSHMTIPQAARIQIMLGSEYFEDIFGAKPAGMWLPECGFSTGIDGLMKEAGPGFFFLEDHGAPCARHSTGPGIYAPVRTPAGPVAFLRDAESSRQVWSSVGGYPGDPVYREFYRDIGFELDEEYLGACLPGGTRTFTGFKYYRITGKSDKEPYVPEDAMVRAKQHALHFVRSRQRQIKTIGERLGIRPLVTAAYDAELFGHWWFEGPQWLDLFLRTGAGQRTFRFVTPSEYLSENGGIEVSMLSLSSWGDKGFSFTWVHPSNSWIYRHLNRAARLMTELADSNGNATGICRRALNQAARELLLAQASDWAFMMKTGNASAFGEDKFREHVENFFILHHEISRGSINAGRLKTLECRNNIFPKLDYRIFRRPSGEEVNRLRPEASGKDKT